MDCSVVDFTLAMVEIADFIDQNHMEKEQGFLFIRCLEAATFFESEDEDLISPVLARTWKTLPKVLLQNIVGVRNSEPVSKLSLLDERYLYKTLKLFYKG